MTASRLDVELVRRGLARSRGQAEEMIRDGRSDDPRIANPGMAEEHAHLMRLAAEHRRAGGRLTE